MSKFKRILWFYIQKNNMPQLATSCSAERKDGTLNFGKHLYLWLEFEKKKSLAIKFLFSSEGRSFYLSMDGNMVKTQLEIEAGVTEEKFFSPSRSLFHLNSFSWLLPSITSWLSLTQSGKWEQREVTSSEIIGKNYETTETRQWVRQKNGPPEKSMSSSPHLMTLLWLRQGGIRLQVKLRLLISWP